MSSATEKTIDTLVEDIYDVVSTGSEVNEQYLQEFLNDCKEALTRAIQDGGKVRPPELRMSMLGTPNRQLWYSFNSSTVKKPVKPSMTISFMYGHIVEALIVFLAKQAGHSVTRQQETVCLEGIKGHIDCFIDNVLVDVKSASGYGFNKFKDMSIRDKGNDPYGYVDQLSGYAQALGQSHAALLGSDKSSGELVLVDFDDFTLKNSSDRIKEVKKVIILESPPEEKCYSDIADGESGNRILDKPCTWCSYKEECWADANEGQGLRKFQFSKEIKYFTKLNKMPQARIQEIVT